MPTPEIFDSVTEAGCWRKIVIGHRGVFLKKEFYEAILGRVDEVVRQERKAAECAPIPSNPSCAEGLDDSKARAEYLLPHKLLKRTQIVVERCLELSHIWDGRGLLSPTLLADVAWSHMLGHSPALKLSGFEPYDAANYLEGRGERPALVALVAKQSYAPYAYKYFGLNLNLFDSPPRLAWEVLSYVDSTTSDDGDVVSLDERYREIVARYGMNSVHQRSAELFFPFMRIFEGLYLKQLA